MSGFKAAHKAGVRLAMGTDSGVPFTRHGNNLDELQHLVEMGLSPQEAIRVATLDSARLLNLDDRIGSLDEGKNADLVIVDGNPMVDIAVLRAQEKIRRVVLNGKTVLDRDASRLLGWCGISKFRMSAFWISFFSYVMIKLGFQEDCSKVSERFPAISSIRANCIFGSRNILSTIVLRLFSL